MHRPLGTRCRARARHGITRCPRGQGVGAWLRLSRIESAVMA